MLTVAATEFAKNFGQYREAVQREPVAVTSHDRVTGVFLSAREYAEYQRLKSLMGKAYAVEELSEETLQAIAASRMDARHDALNALLDD